LAKAIVDIARGRLQTATLRLKSRAQAKAMIKFAKIVTTMTPRRNALGASRKSLKPSAIPRSWTRVPVGASPVNQAIYCGVIFQN
jgi:hypothetical protein